MIGVICHGAQQPIVGEFFELFKTPWQFYVQGETYDVVIVTALPRMMPLARLVIVCGQPMRSRQSQKRVRRPQEQAIQHAWNMTTANGCRLNGGCPNGPQPLDVSPGASITGRLSAPWKTAATCGPI